jgi:hypothetical protein
MLLKAGLTLFTLLVSVSGGSLDHRALAALREISLRCLADNAFALAGPPALPPLRASLVRFSEDSLDMRDLPPRFPISDRNFRTAAGVGDFGLVGIGVWSATHDTEYQRILTMLPSQA